MWDRRKDEEGGAFNVFRISSVSTRATPGKQLVYIYLRREFIRIVYFPSFVAEPGRLSYLFTISISPISQSISMVSLRGE